MDAPDRRYISTVGGDRDYAPRSMLFLSCIKEKRRSADSRNTSGSSAATAAAAANTDQISELSEDWSASGERTSSAE